MNADWKEKRNKNLADGRRNGPALSGNERSLLRSIGVHLRSSTANSTAHKRARVSSNVLTPADAPRAVQQSAAARLANLPAWSSGMFLRSATSSAPNHVSPAPVVSTTSTLYAGTVTACLPSSR